MREPALSFVIPARNEQAQIAATVRAAAMAADQAGLDHQLLVVDHGSQDRTAERARGAGAEVLHAPTARSVAELRNRGTAHTTGEVLVFIDADVTLSQEWAERIGDTLSMLAAAPRTLTGSEVVCPPHGTWLERVWFGVSGKDRSHINSGHLIVTRDFFDELGGFDAALVTAEDFDLSQRALAAGGSIEARPALAAYHHGYPKSLAEFFRREVWHGLGSAGSWHGMTASKVGLATLAVLASVPVGLLGALWVPWLAALPVAALAGISVLAAWLRPRRSAVDLPAVAWLYAVYFAARCTSVAARLAGADNLYWKSG